VQFHLKENPNAEIFILPVERNIHSEYSLRNDYEGKITYSGVRCYESDCDKNPIKYL
jgi:hypothetical protein